MLQDLDVSVDYLQYSIKITEIQLDQNHMPLLHKNSFLSSIPIMQKIFI